MITALRGMAQVPVPGLQTGGVAWITNLVEADPYYILPIVTTLTLATMVEVGACVFFGHGMVSCQDRGCPTARPLLIIPRENEGL